MRRMLVLIAGLVAVVLFGGCAPKGVISNISRNYYYNNNIYLINSRSDFTKNKWAFQLQEVSEFGLKHGWRYFAIVKPDRISNTKGATFNTFEEINKFCSSSFDCGEDNIAFVNWEVRYFKKQPINYITFDAKAVLKDLKQKGLYFDKLPEGAYDHRFRKMDYDEARSLSPF